LRALLLKAREPRDVGRELDRFPPFLLSAFLISIAAARS
jgi:hypothetical protein